MARPKARRRRQNHIVHAAADHVLISVESQEAAIVGDIDRVAELFNSPIAGGNFLQFTSAAVKPVLENVAQGMNLDVGSGMQDIVGGAGAASPAADQANFDHFAAGRVDVADQAPIGGQGSPGHGRGFQKLSTCRLRLSG